MDVFLVKLSLILGHIATAMLPLIMNNLPQKYIHSGLTFVIKRPLRYLLPLSVIAAMASCSGSGDKEKAEDLLAQAETAVKEADYQRAILLTDSIKRAYPKEIDTRRRALHVASTATEGLTLRQLETADSILAVTGVRGDSLSRLVKFVSNPIEGYYTGASVNPSAFHGTTGIQARVSPGGDFYIISSIPVAKGVKSTSVAVSCDGESIATSTVPHDGERNDRSLGAEIITFMGVECEDLGRFIADNRDRQLTLTFNGAKSVSVPLPKDQAEEVATLYDYASTLREAKLAAIEKERLTRALDLARSQSARTYIEKDSLVNENR